MKEEKIIAFDDLEKIVFQKVCEIGREVTKQILEHYDTVIMQQRDKKKYRLKQIRSATIKTVYGEVEYKRRMYSSKDQQGKISYSYLLDEEMQIRTIGTISANLAEKIANTAINESFRAAAKTISNTTGQTISHQAAWRVVQEVGEEISVEEKKQVEKMNTGNTEGKIEAPVLFTEMDGVWLSMQKPDHKNDKGQEIKLLTVYDGWNEDNEKKLHNKKVFANFEPIRIFRKKSEAFILNNFNLDETELRVLNGDGAYWIKNTDPDVIYQLDRFHILKEITTKIKNENIRAKIKDLFYSNKIDYMLETIQMYADSVDNDNENDHAAEDARKLYAYLNNNKEGLLPYQKRGTVIPHPPDGVVYKNPGVQENQNCSLITMRMKHRRMRWSVSGANNLARLIYARENADLNRIIKDAQGGLVKVFADMPDNISVATSAADIKKTVGKGNRYLEILNASVPIFQSRKSITETVLRNFVSHVSVI